MRIRHFASASAVALAFVAFSSVAQAQEAEPGVTDRAQNTRQTEATAATENQGASTVEEIIVTAQKREQSLQDVPIVVTAISEQALQDAGVRDIKDLTVLTPGVTVTSTSSEASTTARVRGVGTVGDNPGLESSVGIVIDGVYRPRNGVGFNDLGEIERVEVLKGPQGTLFGKNTSAGVINVISKAPDFDFGLDAEATVGNYGALETSASVTGPLIEDKLAGRFFAAFRQRDGLYDVQTGTVGPRARPQDNDRNYYTLRGQLLWTPTEDLDVRLIADYTNRQEFCCVGVNVVRNPLRQGYIDFLSQQVQGVPGTLNPPNPSERLAFANRPTDQNVEDGGVSLEATYDINPDVTLTSITAYRQWETRNGQDTEFTTADVWYREPGQNSNTFSFWTQELRLAGTSDRLDWLVGGFYSREELDRQDRIVYGPDFERYFSLIIAGQSNPALFPAAQFLLSNTASAANPFGLPAAAGGGLGAPGTVFAGRGNNDYYAQTTDSLALFTNNSFRATEQLELTLGLRYTMEEKSVDTLYTNPNGAGGCGTVLGRYNAFGQPAALLPLLGAVCVLPTSDPAFNLLRTSQSREEEELTGTVKAAYRFNEDLLTYASYARGYKAGGFNLDRARKGFGVAETNTSFEPEFVDSYELGLKSELFNNSLLANATLFHQTFENFQLNTFTGVSFIVASIPEVVSRGVDADFIYITPVEGLTLNGGITYAETQYGDFTPSAGVSARLPGSRLSFAPLYSLSLSGTYERPVGNGLLLRTSLSGKYSSSYNTGSDLAPEKVQNGFTVVNGRVGIGTEDGRYTLEAFANNLFDEDYFQVAFDAPLQNEATRPAVNAFLGAPRLFGVTFRVNY
jgi:outer membrane receptor protein involved in Fe transport